MPKGLRLERAELSYGTATYDGLIEMATNKLMQTGTNQIVYVRAAPGEGKTTTVQDVLERARRKLVPANIAYVPFAGAQEVTETSHKLGFQDEGDYIKINKTLVRTMELLLRQSGQFIVFEAPGEEWRGDYAAYSLIKKIHPFSDTDYNLSIVMLTANAALVERSEQIRLGFFYSPKKRIEVLRSFGYEVKLPSDTRDSQIPGGDARVVANYIDAENRYLWYLIQCKVLSKTITLPGVCDYPIERKEDLYEPTIKALFKERNYAPWYFRDFLGLKSGEDQSRIFVGRNRLSDINSINVALLQKHNVFKDPILVDQLKYSH